MTGIAEGQSELELSPAVLTRLLRERDQLLLLHEALADVERARTLDERLRVLVHALHRLGYGRVETRESYVTAPDANVVSTISNSAYLESNELIVPLRAVDGSTIATLVLSDPAEPGPPSLARVRTVELFAQQVASIIANARLYEESQLERARGEAVADVARAISGSLRLSEVMQLGLRHTIALVRAQGAAIALLRDDQLVIVAGIGSAEHFVGAPVPVDGSISGGAIRERRTLICNDASTAEAYAPTRIAANVERTLVAPLFSGSGATGVLSVINRDAEFTNDDAVVLQRLADQLAVAIDNARLYEEAKSAADRYRQSVEDERRARDAVAQSEARYRNLFETATDAIYTLDPSGAFSSVNEATCQLTGRSREELLGRSPLPLITPSEVAGVKEHFKSALAGMPRRYECHFVRADGTRRLASVTNTPIRHGTQVIGILGVARDITEDRERAQALERSEARYSRLVESASDAIITLDPNGTLASVNQALERATGLFRHQLIGRVFDELLDPRDHAAYANALRDTFSGARRRVELRYLAANGETRMCSLRLTPLTEAGVVMGALGIMRDVTDERRMTEQLIQQEKLAAVGQLVSGVAHELNNPLASVMAFAQLLLAAPAGSQHDTRAIDAINQEAKRAARIVSNLLTFARQHQPERTVADLNRVVEDTLELRRYGLRVARVEIETRLASDLPVTWADPFQLQQVVLNLLVNAEHALQSWDGARRITITTARADDQLVLRVGDSGPGIPAENLSRIFNPFFTTKPVGEGTGLGLSISDGIVREHGGRIRVESRPGAGAQFTIELPYVPPPQDTPAVDAPASSVASAARRLLVVDDETTIRNAIATYFRSLGHQVETAGSGREAVARVSAASYDILLIDLRLPDLGGDEVLRELELIGRAPARVVFVTGDTQSESARQALASTGRPVVAKPFLLDELAAVALAEAKR